jgi:hypothetical protein
MPEDPSDEEGEPIVRCPVEGCGAEKLSRGMHLHVLRSVGDGHGEQGEYPEGIDLENLEVVGRKEVNVDYPEEREAESVARLCPYCERPFKGKNGVLIHLGQMAGRKDHPQNASEVHEPTDFPVVKLDEDENVIAVVNSGVTSSDTGSAEQPDEEGESETPFATFSKDEVDKIYSTLSEAGVEDEDVKRILQRPYQHG